MSPGLCRACTPRLEHQAPLQNTTFYFALQLDITNSIRASLDGKHLVVQQWPTMVCRDVSNNKMSGTLPSSWSSLVNLEVLKLDNNTLGGVMPSSWVHMTNLAELTAAHNRLTGALPVEFGAFRQLKYMDLRNNLLSGSLPGLAWSRLQQLRILHLSGNALTGQLPESWAHLTQMLHLSVARNNLEGTLPASWSLLKRLRQLDVSDNARLTGYLPPAWSAMSSLQTLSLAGNSLTGSVPPSWSHSYNLARLELQGNAGLCGGVPKTMLSRRVVAAQGSGLSLVHWSRREGHTRGAPATSDVLDSSEPSQVAVDEPLLLAGCPWDEEVVSLLALKAALPIPPHSPTSAQYTSSMTEAAWRAKGLQKTMVVTAGSPSAIEDEAMQPSTPLPAAKGLDVMLESWRRGTAPCGATPWTGITCSEDIRVTGISVDCSTAHPAPDRLTSQSPLPSNLSTLSSLEHLELRHCSLIGPLPATWSLLQNLSSLTLRGGQLTGPLPGAWAALSRLSHLDVGSNSLTATLPTSWSSLNALVNMSLDNNQLTGTLPAAWGEGMASLTSLHLDGNLALAGSLPPAWSQLTQLHTLTVSPQLLSAILPTQWLSVSGLVSGPAAILTDPAARSAAGVESHRRLTAQQQRRRAGQLLCGVTSKLTHSAVRLQLSPDTLERQPAAAASLQLQGGEDAGSSQGTGCVRATSLVAALAEATQREPTWHTSSFMLLLIAAAGMAAGSAVTLLFSALAKARQPAGGLAAGKPASIPQAIAPPGLNLAGNMPGASISKHLLPIGLRHDMPGRSHVPLSRLGRERAAISLGSSGSEPGAMSSTSQEPTLLGQGPPQPQPLAQLLGQPLSQVLHNAGHTRSNTSHLDGTPTLPVQPSSLPSSPRSNLYIPRLAPPRPFHPPTLKSHVSDPSALIQHPAGGHSAGHTHTASGHPSPMPQWGEVPHPEPHTAPLSIPPHIRAQLLLHPNHPGHLPGPSTKPGPLALLKTQSCSLPKQSDASHTAAQCPARLPTSGSSDEELTRLGERSPPSGLAWQPPWDPTWTPVGTPARSMYSFADSELGQPLSPTRSRLGLGADSFLAQMLARRTGSSTERLDLGQEGPRARPELSSGRTTDGSLDDSVWLPLRRTRSLSETAQDCGISSAHGAADVLLASCPALQHPGCLTTSKLVCDSKPPHEPQSQPAACALGAAIGQVPRNPPPMEGPHPLPSLSAPALAAGRTYRPGTPSPTPANQAAAASAGGAPGLPPHPAGALLSPPSASSGLGEPTGVKQWRSNGGGRGSEGGGRLAQAVRNSVDSTARDGGLIWHNRPSSTNSIGCRSPSLAGGNWACASETSEDVQQRSSSAQQPQSMDGMLAAAAMSLTASTKRGQQPQLYSTLAAELRTASGSLLSMPERAVFASGQLSHQAVLHRRRSASSSGEGPFQGSPSRHGGQALPVVDMLGRQLPGPPEGSGQASDMWSFASIDAQHG
ncbi:hypothetical protein QJQ45_018229 [Haematococcus lacustris]|nr:hypothetical protein QJQ45_018229 [Haematococcus lacustris]